MKKILSVFCMWLVFALVLSGLPLAQAETTKEPSYSKSFLLSVISKQHKQYTPADFPLLQNISQVYTVKKTTDQQGWVYLLLMEMDSSVTVGVWRETKNAAMEYGEVYDNVLASDYADSQSFVNLSDYRLNLEVGQTASLQVKDYLLAENDYRLSGVAFTVDPTVVDEQVLVENGYREWGLSCIFADENPLTEPWYSGTALVGKPTGQQNQVSEIHHYFGKGESNQNLFELIHQLSKQEGVLNAQLYLSPVAHIDLGTNVEFHCDSENIVSVEKGEGFSAKITALQLGETTVTVTMIAGGKGTATKTCTVTVEEHISYASLNKNVVAVPVGKTVTLEANELCLSQSKYQQVGAYIWVDHEEMTYQQLCQAVNGWAEDALLLAMYQEDYDYITYGSDWWEFHHLMKGEETVYFEKDFGERLNTQSPINEYLIVADDEKTQGKLLNSLWDIGVMPRQWVYSRVAEVPASARWTAEDNEIVTITNTDVALPDLNLGAVIVGEQPGETNVIFTYSDGEKTVTATCFVKVYEQNWPQPIGLGDTCADGEINAKDALAVLRFSVHPHLHFGTITKENVMIYEKLVWEMDAVGEFGDVNRDEKIDAKDALEILKYAVGKPSALKQ